MLTRFAAFVLVVAAAFQAHADIVISEVYPGVSGPDGTAEWFELWNNGNTVEDITGLFYDDDSADPTADEAINLVGGITQLNPGEFLIVLNEAGDDAVDEIAEFETFWGVSGFNYGFTVNGAGLSSGGDAVNVFDGNTAGSNVVASFDYNGVAFDFQTLVLDPDTSTIQAAQEGVLGAFASAGVAGNDARNIVGSPGVAAASVPEPASTALIGLGMMIVSVRRRRS